eukprot:m.38028 g.38028  ORF g.38028 m.38028 type:complete len:268 (+) comp11146_c0_seq2:582-1385(+)
MTVRALEQGLLALAPEDAAVPLKLLRGHLRTALFELDERDEIEAVITDTGVEFALRLPSDGDGDGHGDGDGDGEGDEDDGLGGHDGVAGRDPWDEWLGVTSFVPDWRRLHTDRLATMLLTPAAALVTKGTSAISSLSENSAGAISSLTERSAGAISSLSETSAGALSSSVGAISSLSEKSAGAISSLSQTSLSSLSTASDKGFSLLSAGSAWLQSGAQTAASRLATASSSAGSKAMEIIAESASPKRPSLSDMLAEAAENQTLPEQQ